MHVQGCPKAHRRLTPQMACHCKGAQMCTLAMNCYPGWESRVSCVMPLDMYCSPAALPLECSNTQTWP